MKFLLFAFWAVCPIIFTVASDSELFSLDERWVCNIKNSCLPCLRLPHCSWCGSENKCFSAKLPTFEDYCADNATRHENFGLSFEENAQCACAGGELEQHCFPPGVDATQGSECSGRGRCVCGRCVCNAVPEPDNPTKMIMGEFCEFDNFSCNDGPKCNEGPYLLDELTDNLKSEDDVSEK